MHKYVTGGQVTIVFRRLTGCYFAPQRLSQPDLKGFLIPQWKASFVPSVELKCKFRLHFAPAVAGAWEMIVKHRQIVVAAHVGETYTTMNCGLRMSYFPDSWNEASKKRSDWDFLRMLKVTSALKVIFSVIEDKCSGGQRSSKWGRQHFKTSSR